MKEYNAPQAEVITFDRDVDYVVTTSSVGTAEQASLGMSQSNGVNDQ
ncbi:MAG: hypothetical protein LUI10_03385 [Lachnospiraceae bacterium]|nr:hypothetical protein [Lachnospiraceae bacterium]